ncbi:ester cyclase [Nonomuraea sp. NPDC052265]|uniref:ester cyclase n=1 Tax=Nonomuraea sp. NPDC052265 TaxID=3364374 RepID=UPI0037C88EC1
MTVAREVRDRYTAAFNAHDMKALLRTVSPDGVAISPEGVSQGREELASYLKEFWEAFPDVQAVVVESFEVEDSTVDEFLFVGTHKGPYAMPDGQVIPATGRPIRLRCCYVCTIENGFIASLRLYFDQLELLSQLSCSTTFRHE